MSEKVTRWGFVGAGKMARNMAADVLLNEGSRIDAVASRTARSANRFAKDFSAHRVYDHIEDLVQDPEIDIVYISTPNHLHYPNAKAAIEAGKAVLLEKPFTLNAGQAEDLVGLAKEHHTFLMEAMWIRYLPVIEKLRELIARNAIGKIQLVKAAFHLNLDYGPQHRIYDLAQGGGALLDLGIYPVSFASLVFKQQPDEIASLAKIGATGVDQHFGAIFHYPEGGMAIVSAAVDGEHYQDVQVFGEQGYIRVAAHRAWKYSRMTVAEAGKPEEEFDLPYLGTGYSYQAQEAVRCLQAGRLESDVMPLAETVDIMGTLDRLRAPWGLRYPGE